MINSVACCSLNFLVPQKQSSMTQTCWKWAPEEKLLTSEGWRKDFYLRLFVKRGCPNLVLRVGIGGNRDPGIHSRNAHQNKIQISLFQCFVCPDMKTLSPNLMNATMQLFELESDLQLLLL